MQIGVQATNSARKRNNDPIISLRVKLSYVKLYSQNIKYKENPSLVLMSLLLNKKSKKSLVNK